MKKYIAESVTYLHPDKICDQISDLHLMNILRLILVPALLSKPSAGTAKLAFMAKSPPNHK